MTNDDFKILHVPVTSREKAATAIRAESAYTLKQRFTLMGMEPSEIDNRRANIFNTEGGNNLYDRRKYVDQKTGETYLPWMFSKTLEHDKITGFAKYSDIITILKARRIPNEKFLSNIATSTSISDDDRRKIEGVNADQSYNLIGTDSRAPSVDAYHQVDSREGIFEMAEVYAMSLLRDVPFSDFTLENCSSIKELNSFGSAITGPTENGIIIPNTLFRGIGKDECVGPYISQFLYLPFNYGNIRIDQKYSSEPDNDESVKHQVWLDMQNGKKFKQGLSTSAKYCNVPRVLGSKVHMDPLFQFYYNAALISMQNGIQPAGFDNKKSSVWTTSGGPDILATVAHVALGALRVAWYNKFGIGMKIRPEVYAQRIDLAMSDFDDRLVPGLSTIKRVVEKHIPETLLKIHEQGDHSYKLKLQFAEGSPTHPSWPAGHACVAGACVTILKAMFKCHDDEQVKLPWCSSHCPNPMHSVDGDKLIEYRGEDASQMTIIGEFNKLASNVSIGRNWSGVHYRGDGDHGMALGEEYAITYLMDKGKEYHESQTGLFSGFFLEKFDGSRVMISNDEVKEM